MDDNKQIPSEEGERKGGGGVWLTHRHLGIGGGVIAAMLTLSPIKEWFFTREEGVSQSKEITELKASQIENLRVLRESQSKQFDEVKDLIAKTGEEITRKIDRSNDKMVERVKDEETRRVEFQHIQDRRIDSLEQAVLQYGSKHKTTN
jgi:hypothetical protein